VYLQEAVYLYQRWGAKTKVEMLSFMYGNYLQVCINRLYRLLELDFSLTLLSLKPSPNSPKFEEAFSFSEENASCLEKLELLEVIKVAQGKKTKTGKDSN